MTNYAELSGIKEHCCLLECETCDTDKDTCTTCKTGGRIATPSGGKCPCLPKHTDSGVYGAVC